MKLRILLVGPIPPPFGGIPKYVKDLYKSRYLKNKYQLNLFNTAIPENIRRYEKQNERSYFSFLSDGIVPGVKLVIYVLATIFDFKKYLEKNKPDIIQVFTSSYWGFWRSCIYIIVAKYFNIKVIFHLLNAIDLFWKESSFFTKKIISTIINSCDIVLVQSNGIKTFVNDITTTKVVAIYNGIKLKNDPESFDKKRTLDQFIKIWFLPR